MLVRRTWFARFNAILTWNKHGLFYAAEHSKSDLHLLCLVGRHAWLKHIRELFLYFGYLAMIRSIHLFQHLVLEWRSHGKIRYLESSLKMDGARNAHILDDVIWRKIAREKERVQNANWLINTLNLLAWLVMICCSYYFIWQCSQCLSPGLSMIRLIESLWLYTFFGHKNKIQISVGKCTFYNKLTRNFRTCISWTAIRKAINNNKNGTNQN